MLWLVRALSTLTYVTFRTNNDKERLEGEEPTNYNGDPSGVRAMLYRTIVEDIPDDTEENVA